MEIGVSPRSSRRMVPNSHWVMIAIIDPMNSTYPTMVTAVEITRRAVP